MNTATVHPHEENPEIVEVKIHSEGERDLTALADGIDLIQQIANVLHLSVSISQLKGDADNAD